MGELQLANKRVFSFFVENPISGDDIPRIRLPRALEVRQIIALKIGGGAGTFDWELRHDPDASNTGAGTLIESDTGVSNNTTGDEYAPPFDPGDPTVIPANDWVWLELANVSTGLSRPVAVQVEMIGVEKGP